MLTDANPSSSSSSEVAVQEETLMKYFSGLIHASFGTKRTNGLTKIHWRVSSTAIVFFRQFYLKNDLLQHDPRIIMLAAVFLAGKVEECRVGIRELLDVYDKCTAENIKACELLLIEALEFNLSIKHPQSYVHTLIADFKRLAAGMNGVNSNNNSSSGIGGIDEFMDLDDTLDRNTRDADSDSTARRQWAVAAESALIILQQSSAALSYSPLVVAVAALKHTEPIGLLSISINTYLVRRFGNAASILLEQYEMLSVMLEAAKVPIDLVFLKSVCMERLKRESVWSKAKVKKPKGVTLETVPPPEQHVDNVSMEVT